MKNILIGLLLAALLITIFIKATDRICDKNWSQEFKQTQEYKNMRCPNK